MLNQRFYLYVFCDDQTIIYVGKGQRSTAWNHCYDPGEFGTVVRERGLTPHILFRTDDEVEAFAHQRALIIKFGRRNVSAGPLFNLNDGGSPNGRAASQVIERARQILADCQLSPVKEQLLAAYAAGVADAANEKSASAMRLRHWLKPRLTIDEWIQLEKAERQRTDYFTVDFVVPSKYFTNPRMLLRQTSETEMDSLLALRGLERLTLVALLERREPGSSGMLSLLDALAAAERGAVRSV